MPKRSAEKNDLPGQGLARLAWFVLERSAEILRCGVAPGPRSDRLRSPLRSLPRALARRISTRFFRQIFWAKGLSRARTRTFIERLWRCLGQEDFHLRNYHDIHDLDRSLKRWIERWDTWHPHRLLQGGAPGIPIGLILRNGRVSPPRFSESSPDSESRLYFHAIHHCPPNWVRQAPDRKARRVWP